jgi:hypothetical protein
MMGVDVLVGFDGVVPHRAWNAETRDPCGMCRIAEGP